MQTIVYHSKARKTMCGMGTFCLIGMISFQLTMQNSEMSYFKAYKFTDSDVLDNDIKTAIGWYINNAIDKKRHSFIITLELTKGSTFSIFGMTASTPSYCAAQVFSYALPVPLYGIRNNGTWTWK
ncbi:MAG: hypothetical protein ACLSE2_08920 [[Clostridium] symbiosum]